MGPQKKLHLSLENISVKQRYVVRKYLLGGFPLLTHTLDYLIR